MLESTLCPKNPTPPLPQTGPVLVTADNSVFITSNYTFEYDTMILMICVHSGDPKWAQGCSYKVIGQDFCKKFDVYMGEIHLSNKEEA